MMRSFSHVVVVTSAQYFSSNSYNDNNNNRLENYLHHVFNISHEYIYIYCSHTLKKSTQNGLVSDVIGFLTSFGSSNIIIALPSDPTDTIVPAGDPAVKCSPSTQNPHRKHLLKKIQNATANELLKWNWSMRNDIRHFPSSRDELKR